MTKSKPKVIRKRDSPAILRFNVCPNTDYESYESYCPIVFRNYSDKLLIVTVQEEKAK